MSGGISSLSQYALMTWYLGKHRDNSAFYLLIITAAAAAATTTTTTKTRASSVGIATDFDLDDRISNPGGAEHFSLRHRVQAGSGAHPASYPMGTRGSFLVDKTAGA
jgi:hypothetical protein